MLNLYREIELDADIQAAATLTVQTETPGAEVTLRHTKTLAATSGRTTTKVRMPGDVRGKLLKLKLTSAGTVILYGAKVFAKPLGVESAWAWYPLPVVATPEGWATVALPIVPTATEFGPVALPIPGPPPEFSSVELPIAPTGEGWGTLKVPLHPTPPEPEWVDLPVDAIE